MNPKVSIITPSFNHAHFIEHTILSVKNQDYPNIEHIILDGGSEDHTIEILKKYENKYNMKWMSEKDNGQSDAINKGFAMLDGEITAWLNSDDIYFSSDTVSLIVDEFNKNPDIDVVFGNDMAIDENNEFILIRKLPGYNFKRLLLRNTISQPATFMRTKTVKKHQLNCDLHYIMDLDLWLRLYQNGYKFKHINKIIAGNRLHKQRKMIAGVGEAEKEIDNIRKTYSVEFKKFGCYYLYDRLDYRIKRFSGVKDIFDIINNKYRSFIKLDKNKLMDLIYWQISAKRVKSI